MENPASLIYGYGMAADPVLANVLGLAKKHLKVRGIWLFGSRARGDHDERSDYDLAFDLVDDTGWPTFADECRERAPTLCELDLIRLDRVSRDLVANVRREGRRIDDE